MAIDEAIQGVSQDGQLVLPFEQQGPVSTTCDPVHRSPLHPITGWVAQPKVAYEPQTQPLL